MGFIIKNPYTTGGNWYIGQLHFHTTNSDGTGTPAEMKAAYAAAGYHFVVTTDHRDDAHVGCTPDPGGAGPAWYIGEEEYTTEGHLNSLGISTAIQEPWVAPQAGQTVVDAGRALGGIAQVNHPTTYVPWSWWDELEPLKRYSLIEVVAGNWGPGIDLADEYRQVWFSGGDDAHTVADANGYWCVVVQTASATIAQADIISSLDSGNFYIRQTAAGPTITSVGVSGSTITLTLPSANYTVTWYKKGKRIVKTDTGITTTASCTATGTEGYIFAEVYDGAKYAWTQPLYIINDTDLSNAAAASAGTAANLIDNNAATHCDFGATTGNFTIDLGAAKQANGIRIYWNCATTERWNYKVEESTTGAFAGEETEQVRTTFSNRASTTLDVFDCWTRYIKVTITGASVGAVNASVKEVEVFNASPEISEYYINNVAGSNSNTGFTAATAWSTIAYSLPLIRPRDRLNFINSGTGYTIEAMDDFFGGGNYALGKYAGVRWILHGINHPALSSYLLLRSSNNKFIDIDGFSLSAVIWVSAGNNIQLLRNKFSGGAGKAIWLAAAATEITAAYNTIANFNNDVSIYENLNSGGIAYIYNNVIYGGFAGLYVGAEGNNSIVTVKNNISTGTANTEFVSLSAGMTLTDSNNSTDGTYVSVHAWAKTDNQDVDPQFVNAAGGDFRLKATSPLLRKGVAVGLTTDIAGNSVPAYTGKLPDIGAYENRPGGVFIF